MKLSTVVTLFTLVSGSFACTSILDNYVYDCGTSADAFKLKSAKFTPTTPTLGKKLNMAFDADVKQTIIKGSTVKVTVKSSGTVVNTMDADLCDFLSPDFNICPLAKGPISGSKDLDFVASLPAGTYTADFISTSPTNEAIFNVQLRFTL